MPLRHNRLARGCAHLQRGGRRYPGPPDFTRPRDPGLHSDACGGPADGPRWAASYRAKPILTECGLGLETADAGDLMIGARVLHERRRFAGQRIPVLFGKSDHADDRFREVRYALATPQHLRVDVVFRCYDDAIALRYELPAQKQAASITIINETTSFRLEGQPTAFVQYLESFKTSHEHNIIPIPYRDIQRGVLLDMPLTFSWHDGTHAAITEASLRHYAGMSLMRPSKEEGHGDLVCQLSPRSDGAKVVHSLPMQTPWRVVLMGDRPGALLESETIYCLNDPSVIKDTSWIKPGKISFPWWNGDVYDGRRGPPILSFEMASKYIDFCARHRITAHSLTSTEDTVTSWYQQSKPGVEPGPDTDVTRPRPGFELAAIRRYADSKGCGCGHGCIRPRSTDGWKRRSPHSRNSAGAESALGQAESGRNAFLDRLAEGWSVSGFYGAAAALAIPLHIHLARVPSKE